MVIYNNMAAMSVLSEANRQNNKLSNSMGKLASGLKVRHAGDDAANGVAFGFHALDEVGHLFGSSGIGAAHSVALYRVEVVVFVSARQGDAAHLRGVGFHADALCLQGNLSKSPRHAACRRFACRGTSAAPMPLLPKRWPTSSRV